MTDSLSEKFRHLRRSLRGARTALTIASDSSQRNRWNTVGRTRIRLAEILTAYVRSIPGGDGSLRYHDAQVLPERIHAMRLVGKARIWEDAHSWEATATWPDGGPATTLYSFDTMTACVKAGSVRPIGKDGEVSI